MEACVYTRRSPEQELQYDRDVTSTSRALHCMTQRQQ